MGRRAKTFLTGAALLAGMLPASMADAQRFPCSGALNQELSGLGLGREDVRSIDVEALVSERNEAIQGYLAWIRLNQCESGYLNVEFGASCALVQRYTRGGCQVPEVPEY